MATLKETKKRIASAKTVSKITKAMKLISASKSRAAQAANLASRPYSQRIGEVVSDLWAVTGHRLHPLLWQNTDPRACRLIIGTDKGLCGPLLSRLEDFLTKEKAFEKVGDSYLLVGKKSRELLTRNSLSATAVFELGFKKTTLEMVRPIVKLINDGYLAQNFGKVVVYYTHFVSNLKQTPSQKLLLPAVKPEVQKTFSKDVALYEPQADAVLEKILPRYLSLELYQLVLESVASEHAARMLAMDQACRNADEIIEDLTLSYNKIRQENITRELLEITSALETF